MWIVLRGDECNRAEGPLAGGDFVVVVVVVDAGGEIVGFDFMVRAISGSRGVRSSSFGGVEEGYFGFDVGSAHGELWKGNRASLCRQMRRLNCCYFMRQVQKCLNAKTAKTAKGDAKGN